MFTGSWASVTVIGEQTWGKGTVQNVIPIQRGESALKVDNGKLLEAQWSNISIGTMTLRKKQKFGVFSQMRAGKLNCPTRTFLRIPDVRYVRELKGPADA